MDIKPESERQTNYKVDISHSMYHILKTYLVFCAADFSCPFPDASFPSAPAGVVNI